MLTLYDLIMEEIKMRRINFFSILIFMVILAIGAGLSYAAFAISGDTTGSSWIAVLAVLTAFVVSSSIKVADQWEKAVILRLGRFHSLKGPGLFFIIPVVDFISYWIDTRVITTTFKTEKTLTKDTVPVDVDAVLFWKVIDPKKIGLAVADFQS